MRARPFLLVLLAASGASAASAQVPYDSGAPGVLSDAPLPPSTWTSGGPGRSFRGWDWAVLPSDGYTRSRSGGSTLGPNDKDFYVFGGETPNGLRVATVQVWHRATGAWSGGVAPMPRPVSNIMGSVASNRGLFYVFGGLESGDMPIAEVQRYDPALDSWSVVASLPRPLFGVGAALLEKDRILVFGGADLRYVYADSYVFDVASSSFTPGPALAIADFNISTTHWKNEFDGRIYFTGMRNPGSLQIYDDAVGLFLAGPAFAAGGTSGVRDGCGIASRGQYIVVWAGDWFGFRQDVEVYDCVAGGSGCTIVPGLLMNVGRRSFAYGDTRCPGFLADDGFNGLYLDHFEGVR